MAQVVVLITWIREVLGSNLSRDIHSPDGAFHRAFQSLQEDTDIIYRKLGPDRLFPHPFEMIIHNHSVVTCDIYWSPKSRNVK
jgi:hypothetical protein